MNSPHIGKFKVSQGFRPPSNPSHNGIDLVGIDSKEIHATVSGTVYYAGWENPDIHSQGFGQYVCIRGADGLFYYYGHLSQLRVKSGDLVVCTEIIGIEGSTGHSTGSHCHYEIRGAFYKGAKVYDVCAISGIPNVQGGIYDSSVALCDNSIKALQTALNSEGSDLVVDGISGPLTLAAAQQHTICDGSSGEVVKWLQTKLNSLGYNCGTVDGIAGPNTMAAIHKWQCDHGGVSFNSNDWAEILSG